MQISSKHSNSLETYNLLVDVFFVDVARLLSIGRLNS
jgi:hypothetical protein